MKTRPRVPHVPAGRHETVRKEIVRQLKGYMMSARDISGIVRVSEKDVYDHLYHIRKTLHNEELTLIITPARCRKCGFLFKKRERLEKPGKCPICHGESIEEPLFTIK